MDRKTDILVQSSSNVFKGDTKRKYKVLTSRSTTMATDTRAGLATIPLDAQSAILVCDDNA